MARLFNRVSTAATGIGDAANLLRFFEKSEPEIKELTQNISQKVKETISVMTRNLTPGSQTSSSTVRQSYENVQSGPLPAPVAGPRALSPRSSTCKGQDGADVGHTPGSSSSGTPGTEHKSIYGDKVDVSKNIITKFIRPIGAGNLVKWTDDSLTPELFKIIEDEVFGVLGRKSNDVLVQGIKGWIAGAEEFNDLGVEDKS
jgi:hypothetical protein